MGHPMRTILLLPPRFNRCALGIEKGKNSGLTIWPGLDEAANDRPVLRRIWYRSRRPWIVYSDPSQGARRRGAIDIPCRGGRRMAI